VDQVAPAGEFLHGRRRASGVVRREACRAQRGWLAKRQALIGANGILLEKE
jgi:hypothetical protein